jgi:hypothetical protein
MKKMQKALILSRQNQIFRRQLSAVYRVAQDMAKANQATSSALGGDARVEIYEQSVKKCRLKSRVHRPGGSVYGSRPQFMAESKILDWSVKMR